MNLLHCYQITRRRHGKRRDLTGKTQADGILPFSRAQMPRSENSALNFISQHLNLTPTDSYPLPLALFSNTNAQHRLCLLKVASVL